MKSANCSPNIFTLVLKIGTGYTKCMFLKINQGFANTLQGISFKNDRYFFHRRYPHFQEAHFFYNMKHSTETLFIGIFVC